MTLELQPTFTVRGRKGCAGQVSILVDTKELEELFDARMKGDTQDAAE